MADPLVIFTPSGRRGRVAPGTTVLEAARALGVDLDSVCGGRGICSKCQVAPGFGEFPKHGITARAQALSPWNDVEERYNARRGLAPGRRLGCQAAIHGDVLIDVPPGSQLHKQVIRKDADARAMVMDPATKLYYVAVDPPDMHEPSGDLERLARALEAQWELPAPEAGSEILRALQPALRAGGWRVTVAIHRDTPDARPRITGIWPGFHEGGLHGLAVDLGSTTIAAHLCDLDTGAVLASAGAMNPQIRFGEDLMSRVSYAMMTPGGAEAMTAAVRDALGDLAAGLAADAGIGADTILELVVVGNPVMHHLFLGIDPVELGQAPFALATSDSLRLPAGALGLRGVGAAAQLYMPPCIAGHVGADAAAVVLAEAPQDSEDLVLIVDVGTNAEIFLGDRRRVLACSSPTGPAFEGAQISAGQRAAPGAIERVRIDPATGEPRVRVIGSELWSDEPGFDAAVTGICGSGIIEAVAEMRMAGLVDARGVIGSPAQTGSARCVPDGRTHAYLLHDGPSGQISVTQGDIRAIQLAKAALYAGARLLMDELGVEHVDRIVLAGAFGAHISPRHAMVLGMIPDAPLDRVTPAGNAAGTGARIALCSRAARSAIEATVRRIHKVETALAPRFQDHFVAATALPHAHARFDNLAAAVTLPEPDHGRAPEQRRKRRDPAR